MNISPEAQAILRISAEWRLLSLIFQRPAGEWHTEMRSLAQEVADRELRSAACHSQNATEEIYLSMLGPGGVASPREVAYAGFEDPGKLMAELQELYTVFAYSPKTEEPTDHISVEAGFLGYLALKEAYALMTNNAEGLEVTRCAQKVFLEEHFARLVYGLAEKIGTGGPAYLLQAFDAMRKRIAHIPVAPQNSSAEYDPLVAGCPMAEE